MWIEVALETGVKDSISAPAKRQAPACIKGWHDRGRLSEPQNTTLLELK